MNERPLAGKHAIVTGGGRGIGLAIARELADRGARLTLVGRDETVLAAAAETMGGAHLPVDVADEASVAHAFERAGAADILINNAGIAESVAFGKMDLALWQRHLDTNLTGVFLCTQAALPAMRKTGWGRIVNVASTAALKGYPYVAAYCASKHGVLGLTRSLAVELARTGVTVNAVCPGYTDTAMVDRAVMRIAEVANRTPAEAVAELTKANPQARLVDPKEVAAAVAWLCLPESAAITGQAIAVAGGEVM